MIIILITITIRTVTTLTLIIIMFIGLYVSPSAGLYEHFMYYYAFVLYESKRSDAIFFPVTHIPGSIYMMNSLAYFNNDCPSPITRQQIARNFIAVR